MKLNLTTSYFTKRCNIYADNNNFEPISGDNLSENSLIKRNNYSYYTSRQLQSLLLILYNLFN